MPTAREQEALQRHGHIQELERVDAVWPWLAERHGTITAVDAPHAAHAERFSFAELAQRIATAAAAFQRQGVQEGDVVALFAENSPRWLVADQGLMRCGAADAVRGASAPVEELRYILDDCNATALVVQNADLWRRLDLTASQRQGLRLVLQLEGEPEQGVLGWEAFLASGAGQQSVTPTSGRTAIATVLYTSGTTGTPKGALLTQSALASNAVNSAHAHDLTPQDRILTFLPLFHVGGLNIQTLPALMTGASVLLHRAFDPGEWLKDVERWQPTWSLFVPATLNAVASHPQFEKTELSSLKGLMAGSSTIPEAATRPFFERGIPVG